MKVTRTIEQLAKVLAQTKSVEDKIQETQGKLSCIRKKISETLVLRYLGEGHITVEEDLMKAEQTYERLMQALLDMKKSFEQQMRALDEQIVQANIVHLREVFEEKKNLLAECLDSIDQKILGCLAHVEEYRRVWGDLLELGERLKQLGVNSLELPERPRSEELSEILGERVQHLRSQGKL